MPRLVLLAKSTYVWLDQLSKRHGRAIRTLDAVPDDELATIAARGITGPLADRPVAALAGVRDGSSAGGATPTRSPRAYSLDDYRIADDLGGEDALADLRSRAWQHGIRLASDMVPNHMGIDSSWVIDHPERFIAVRRAALPGLPVRGPQSGRRSASRDPDRGPLLGRQRRRRRLRATRHRDRASDATCTTATTGRASRGTTRPSSTS